VQINVAHAPNGVYRKEHEKEKLEFIPFKKLAAQDLQQLTYRISQRIAGYLERDVGNSYLTGNLFTQDEMQIHRSHSVNYRIAMGAMKGKKIFSLQTLLPAHAEPKAESVVAKVDGFSLHAGVV
jgi:hypothetical protein